MPTTLASLLARSNNGFVIFDSRLQDDLGDGSSITTLDTRKAYLALLEELKNGTVTRRQFRARCQQEVVFVDDSCFGLLKQRAAEQAALRHVIDDNAAVAAAAAAAAATAANKAHKNKAEEVAEQGGRSVGGGGGGGGGGGDDDENDSDGFDDDGDEERATRGCAGWFPAAFTRNPTPVELAAMQASVSVQLVTDTKVETKFVDVLAPPDNCE